MPEQYRNMLLRLMDKESLALIAPHLEPFEMKKMEVVAEAGEPSEFIYFVEAGILSLISQVDEKRDVELGIVGREGMSGEAIMLGDDRSPFQVHVQMPGRALRAPVARVKEAMLERRALQDFLLRFARAQYLQLSSTLAAHQRGSLEERLARWILMGYDRVDGNRFHVTHEAIAWILGVRRPSVTEGLHLLEGRALIRSNRGEIVVRDAAGLRAAAGGTYGGAEREYARLMGEDFRGNKKSVGPDDAPEMVVPHEGGAPEDLERP